MSEVSKPAKTSELIAQEVVIAAEVPARSAGTAQEYRQGGWPE